LAFRDMLEKKVPVETRVKFPVLDKLIPLTNYIACCLAVVLLVTVIALIRGGSRSSSPPATLSTAASANSESLVIASDSSINLTADSEDSRSSSQNKVLGAQIMTVTRAVNIMVQREITAEITNAILALFEDDSWLMTIFYRDGSSDSILFQNPRGGGSLGSIDYDVSLDMDINGELIGRILRLPENNIGITIRRKNNAQVLQYIGRVSDFEEWQ